MSNEEIISENNDIIQECIDKANSLPDIGGGGGGGTGATFTLCNASDYDACVNGVDVWCWDDRLVPVSDYGYYVGFIVGDVSNAYIHIFNPAYEDLEAYIMTQVYDENMGFTFFMYMCDHYPDDTWVLEVIEE